MFVTSFIVNLYSFIFGSSLFILLISLVFYILIIRYVLLPLVRQILPFILSIISVGSVKPQRYVLVELIPVARTETTPQATAELLGAIYHVILAGRWQERLLSGSNRISLELVASKHSGIRYLMRLPESHVEVIETLLHSYQPEISLNRSEEYLPPKLESDDLSIQVANYSQAGYFAYPLKDRANDEMHDLIGYMMGAMTKLNDKELLSFQMVLEPSVSSISARVRNHLQAGATSRPFSIWSSPLRAVQWITYNLVGNRAHLPDVSGQEIRTLMLEKLA